MESVELTASMVITFAGNLEDSTASFYEDLAELHEEQGQMYLGFAKDSRKAKVLVVRTYQETITDALEACFCFEGMSLENYNADSLLPAGISPSDALRRAIVLEDTAIGFYTEAAERSASYLATIPGAFRRAAKTRSRRKLKLEALLES